MRATFRKIEYGITAGRIEGDAAALANPPHLKRRFLKFDLASIYPHKLLEILIHEALHACLWDLDEPAIEETARDIAKFLKQLEIKADAQRIRRILRTHGKRRTSARRTTHRHKSKS